MCWVHPPPWLTVDKRSIQFYEGANTNLHFPLLQGGGFIQEMCQKIFTCWIPTTKNNKYLGGFRAWRFNGFWSKNSQLEI